MAKTTIEIAGKILKPGQAVTNYPLEAILLLQKHGTFTKTGEALTSAFGGRAKILQLIDSHPEWLEGGVQRNILEQL